MAFCPALLTKRIDPLEIGVTAQPGARFTFVIPEGIWDLSTLRIWGAGTYAGGLAHAMSWPRDIECLIDTLEIYIGSRLIQFTTNFGHLVRILQDYNADPNMLSKRALYSSPQFLPPGLGNTFYDPVNFPCSCFSFFPGFIDSKEVIDVRQFDGPLRIVLNFNSSPNVMVGAASTTWQMTDLHMCIKEGLAEDVSQDFEFDNFKSVAQSQSTYNSQTQMMVSGRKLDYVLATYLNVAYMNTQTSQTLGGTGYYFVHGIATGAATQTWNFLVNGVPLLSHDGTVYEAIATMEDIFQDGSVQFPLCAIFSFGGFGSYFPSALLAASWCAACDLQKAAATTEPISIVFNSMQVPPAALVSNMVLMISNNISRLAYAAGEVVYEH